MRSNVTRIMTNSDDLRLGPISILLVHPNPLIQERFGQVLREEGFRVRVVGSGGDAIAIVRRHKIDAALLDINGSSDRIPTILTAMQMEAPHLPVVLLAGNANKDTIATALDLGALAFASEPYDLEVLKALLRRALAVKAGETVIARKEQRLRERDERLRFLVESTPDAIVTADHRGHIITWNQGAHRLFLYTEPEVQGRPLTVLMPVRYHAAHQQGLERFRFTAVSLIAGATVEFHGLRKDGSEFPLELSLSSWKTADGIAYGGIMRDISRRRHMRERPEEVERKPHGTVQDTCPG
ncbi:MAG: PAS domain S-box protein [Nitrospirae bacterium]|nr:MAG: PAS domain S-box protein [Nitrospirota bacterium]